MPGAIGVTVSTLDRLPTILRRPGCSCCFAAHRERELPLLEDNSFLRVSIDQTSISPGPKMTARDWREMRHIASDLGASPTPSCVYKPKPSPDRRCARFHHFSTSARPLRRRVELSCPIGPR